MKSKKSTGLIKSVYYIFRASFNKCKRISTHYRKRETTSFSSSDSYILPSSPNSRKACLSLNQKKSPSPTISSQSVPIACHLLRPNTKRLKYESYADSKVEIAFIPPSSYHSLDTCHLWVGEEMDCPDGSTKIEFDPIFLESSSSRESTAWSIAVESMLRDAIDTEDKEWTAPST